MNKRDAEWLADLRKELGEDPDFMAVAFAGRHLRRLLSLYDEQEKVIADLRSDIESANEALSIAKRKIESFREVIKKILETDDQKPNVLVVNISGMSMLVCGSSDQYEQHFASIVCGMIGVEFSEAAGHQ